jgi:hypothetical protein
MSLSRRTPTPQSRSPWTKSERRFPLSVTILANQGARCQSMSALVACTAWCFILNHIGMKWRRIHWWHLAGRSQKRSASISKMLRIRERRNSSLPQLEHHPSPINHITTYYFTFPTDRSFETISKLIEERLQPLRKHCWRSSRLAVSFRRQSPE